MRSRTLRRAAGWAFAVAVAFAAAPSAEAQSVPGSYTASPTSNSITWSWTASSMQPSCTYESWHKKTLQSGLYYTGQHFGNADSRTVSGLEPNTSYRLRVRSCCYSEQAGINCSLYSGYDATTLGTGG